MYKAFLRYLYTDELDLHPENMQGKYFNIFFEIFYDVNIFILYIIYKIIFSFFIELN